MTDRKGSLKIVVATLTRRRPEMLDALLASLGAMEMPSRCKVSVLVVENDDTARLATRLHAMGPLGNGAPLAYVHEPELGIPFGRNRAAREAIAQGADLLVFVDDDEIVAADWLVALIRGYRASSAVLMGAPLRALPTDPEPRGLAGMMYRGVRARYARKERRAADRASLDATPGVTIVTNNWLGETALFAEHGLWFDEAMRFTGGTDSKFCAETKARGLPTGWVADAHVYEEIPPARLGIGYQFRRGRDQSATNFHRKLERGFATAAASVLVSVPLKVLSVLALVLAVPFTRGRTLLDAARQSGWIAGRLSALAGRRSALYGDVTGR